MLLTFLALRLAVAFLPCRNWGPSGYLCAAPHLFLPAEVDHSVEAERAFGEGARVGNLLKFKKIRGETFTVDQRGYRNPFGPLPRPPRVLLQGSSFSLGMSLSDTEILSEQLNLRLGPVVYNASKTFGDSLTAETAIPLAAELEMNEGWVLLELLNRAPYTHQPAPEPPHPRQAELQARYRRWRAPVARLYRQIHDPFALIGMSSELNMRLHDDRWLPNPMASQYLEEELTNGQRMLFYHQDRQFFHATVNAASSVKAVVRLRQDLLSAGLRLAVLLVPSGYAVYYPLIRGQGGHEPPFLEELNSGLSRAGIPVFHALPLLREAARSELASGQLLYWPDDAHWNPAGCALVASAAAPWLRSLIGDPEP